MTGDDAIHRRRAIEPRAHASTRTQPHTMLGSGPEFDLIRQLLGRWGASASRIGDDAAAITSLGEWALIVSTDTSVENVHFRSEWLTPAEIGYRALAAALSDLAAMGAMPLGVLSALTIPDSWRDRIDALADGIGEAARTAEVIIIGGDISNGSELSLNFTVLGTARDVLFRTAARPGDLVFMTGRLGGAGAALRALLSGNEPSSAHRRRFAHPAPRIREAIWLAEQGATAAIDISDGLSADLGHLAVASGVKLSIDLKKVRCAEGVTPTDAASSGEEYELVVTTPTSLDKKRFELRFDAELTEIGRVEQGPAEVLFQVDGEQVAVPGGYQHFTR